MARAPVDPKIARAAANMRIAGVSERDIYESFRTVLKEPPSYRQLRDVWKEYGVGYRSVRGKRNIYLRYDKSGVLKRKKGASAYRERLKFQHTPKERAKLKRDYALGYLIEQGPPADVYKDRAIVQYITSDYETGY